jgi:hypothetical protein
LWLYVWEIVLYILSYFLLWINKLFNVSLLFLSLLMKCLSIPLAVGDGKGEANNNYFYFCFNFYKYYLIFIDYGIADGWFILL